jgi:two-component system phosphate regulon sensor histidine kinase PhoR
MSTFLARIEEQADRLHRLIIEMLPLARIEAEEKRVEIDSVDLAEIAPACIDEHRHAAAAKQIELRIEPNEQREHTSKYCVQANREGLHQIVGNLLDNAIKYTPAGGKISLAWQLDDDRVHLLVRDTGVGIRAHVQERIFERFYRVDKARSRELGGTGLGLAIVKHLVNSFDGTVHVESEYGQGSTFTVCLRRA